MDSLSKFQISLSFAESEYIQCRRLASVSFHDFKRPFHESSTIDIFIPRRLTVHTSFEGTIGGKAKSPPILLSPSSSQIRIRSGTVAISKPVAHNRRPIRGRSEIEGGSREEAIYVISMEGTKDPPEELWRLFAYEHERSILIERPSV